MKDNATSLAMREVAQAVRDLKPAVPREERGYTSELERFPALRVALRFCVDIRGPGDVEGLAGLFRRVPESHVDRAEGRVRCVCEALVPFGDLTPCPGGCGRFFAADGEGAFVARFEAEAVAAAARELEERS